MQQSLPKGFYERRKLAVSPQNQNMDEVYRRHARSVYAFLLAKTADRMLAEELTQETF